MYRSVPNSIMNPSLSNYLEEPMVKESASESSYHIPEFNGNYQYSVQVQAVETSEMFALDPVSAHFPKFLQFSVFEHANSCGKNILFSLISLVFLIVLFIFIFTSKFGVTTGNAFSVLCTLLLSVVLIALFHVSSVKIILKIFSQFEFWYLEGNLIIYSLINIFVYVNDPLWDSSSGLFMELLMEVNYFVAITTLFILDSYVTVPRYVRIFLFCTFVANNIRHISIILFLGENKILIYYIFGLKFDILLIRRSLMLTVAIFFCKYFHFLLWKPKRPVLLKSSLVFQLSYSRLNECYVASTVDTDTGTDTANSMPLLDPLSIAISNKHGLETLDHSIFPDKNLILFPVYASGDFQFDPIIDLLPKCFHVQSSSYPRVVLLVACLYEVAVITILFMVDKVGWLCATVVSSILSLFLVTFVLHAFLHCVSIRLFRSLLKTFEFWYLVIIVLITTWMKRYININTSEIWMTPLCQVLLASMQISRISIIYSLCIDCVPILPVMVRVGVMIANLVNMLSIVFSTYHDDIPLFSFFNWNIDIVSAYRSCLITLAIFYFKYVFFSIWRPNGFVLLKCRMVLDELCFK